MKFAKVVDGRLIFAPSHIVKEDGAHLFTNDTAVMIQYGYKEVVHTPMPTEETEGYYWSSQWVETETQCVIEWTSAPEEEI